MSEKRTIRINPELFKIPDTRKNRKSSGDKTNDENRIKIKTPLEKNVRNKTVRKNIINMIRAKQQEEYSRLFDEDTLKKPSEPNSPDFNSDFDESLKYLSNLVDQSKTKENLPHNQTLKNRDSLFSNHASIVEPMGAIQPVNIDVNSISPSVAPVQILPPPQYGCLKNGSLPTYRVFHNKTVKNPVTNIPTTNIPTTNTPILNTNPPPVNPRIMPAEYTNKIAETKKMNEQMKLLHLKKTGQQMKKNKQRKILRRTYRVGRSKYYPKVSVLVSNRTIRKNITTKTHELKETPIAEIKQFLIKRGLIKIGTPAPNDVLRKMYETVNLICGDINNHNTDILLHNFIHT